MTWRRTVGIVAALLVAGAFAHAQSDGSETAPENLAAEQARTLVGQGLQSAGKGDNDDALVAYTQAINAGALSPEDRARALFDRGVTLDAMGRTNDAIGDYSGALKLAPGFAAALNNRANAFRRLHRLEEAKSDYLASLAAGNLMPEYPEYGLGQIAEAEGNIDVARHFYGEALAANPSYLLAARSLEALGHGGGPQASSAGPSENAQIVLKPPPAMPAPQQDVADAAADAPIVLKPPPARAAPAPKVADANRPSGPTLSPASYGRADADPTLRPAIEDGSGHLPARSANAGPTAKGPLVQLGAWRDEASAADGWNRILGQSDGALSGLKPQIVAVDLPGKGRYFRLRTVPADAGGASALCAALKDRGLACMVVKDN